MFRKEPKVAATTAQQQHESMLKQNTQNAVQASQGAARRRHRNTKRLGPFRLIGGMLVCIVIVIGIFISIAYYQSYQPAAGVIGPTDSQVLSEVTHVKQDVVAKVNTGGMQSVFQTTGSSQKLTGQGGKPEIFYYGAEFCPYCGAQRWSLVVALSRFGTFSQLPEGLSSDQDRPSNISTFTFVKSHYTSPYIDFVPVEVKDRNQNALQTPDANERRILKQYNVTSIPFIDIAGRYVATSTIFDPALLQGHSQKDIANRLSDPNDQLTRNIVGGANYLTAAICSVTHDQPTSVCTQRPISTLEQSVVHSPRLAQSSPYWFSWLGHL